MSYQLKKPRRRKGRPLTARFTYCRAEPAIGPHNPFRLAFLDGERVMFTAVCDRDVARSFVDKMNNVRLDQMGSLGRELVSTFVKTIGGVDDVDDPRTWKRRS